MKVVATKDKYKLEHSIIDGFLGQPQDFFEVTWRDETGIKYHAPAFPPIRIKVTDLMFEPLQPYTEKEYMEILEKAISKLNI